MIDFKRIDHLLITIPPGQTQVARIFYNQVLALTEIPGNHPKGAIWFEMSGMQLHVREEQGHSATSDRHPAFEVAQLQKAKQFLQQQGISISYSSEIEGRDRLFFRDPWGNRFELIEYNQTHA